MLIKSLLSPLLFVQEHRNVKKIMWKSCPVNLLQVSNLTFDPCFKVKLDQHTEKALYLLIIGTRT